MPRGNGRRKQIRQLDIETSEEIEIYNSITEAAEDNWTSFDVLSEALRKKNGVLREKKLRFEYVN